MSKPSMSEAAKLSLDAARVKPAKVYNAKATPGRRGKRGLTVYLDPMVHADLKDIAELEDKQLQTLLLEGINLVLQQHGKKPIA